MKMKRLAALLLAGVLIFTLGACKGKDKGGDSSSEQEVEKDPNYPVSIGDIKIAQRPEQVVSLSPALTEMICELGGEDRLSGVSDFCDYPDMVQDFTRCGTPQLPNLNEIKKISPQVVFASSTFSQEDTVRLQQMGAEVVVLPHADSLDSLEEIYITIAMVLDGNLSGKQNGQAVFAPLRKQYDALVSAAGGIEKPVSGIYLRMVPMTMATGDTFEGELMQSIGIQNDAADFSGWIYPADKAVDLYPDVIFYDKSIDPQYLKDNKVYNTTDAVKNSRCYEIDATAFERQSGRMFDELTEMFKAVYPDVEIASGAGNESSAAENPEQDTSSLSGVIEEPK
ncbi:helical backbone metal receptor [Oscillospiraceae bacterium PP1C4]